MAEEINQAVAIATDAVSTIADWIEAGRSLVSHHRQTEWLIADWVRIGADKFHDDPQMTLFLDEIGVDPKRAIADAKVAALIPPSWRTDRVSFAVCRQIARIDDPMLRQRLIHQAVEEHWNERSAKHAVVEHRGDTLIEDDMDDRMATEIERCWNRASTSARQIAYERITLAAAENFRVIDQDVAA